MTALSDTDRSDGFRLPAAAPFWLSFCLIPQAWISAIWGGWLLALLPLTGWLVFSSLDSLLAATDSNADPDAPDAALHWHRAVTALWVPLQVATVFGILIFVTVSGHLGRMEEIALFAGLGILSGAIGITYGHELMHQKPKWERWLGDILMTSVLYGHFRSEHLLVHHRYVATPRDHVTARFGESFWSFLPRVLVRCARSAFRAERAMLARIGRPWWNRRNPFWRYAALQAGFLLAAGLIGGWWGLALFLTQAAVAIFQLELVNYVEHYGLTRRHLGSGRYEHVKPRHSWNSDKAASNWLLINLQRHSDHHFKPDRRFPLLQTYGGEDAPQLPSGYPVMTALALVPPVWRRVMDPRVRAWRAHHYPDIEDWTAYDTATNPLPR